MAGTPRATVHDIFLTMDDGPAAAPSLTCAQAWLDHHRRTLGFFIDGNFVLPPGRPTQALLDSQGAEVCSHMLATDDDITECISSSVIGRRSWAALSCQQRSKVLLRMAGLLGQHGQCVSQVCDLSGASCSSGALVRLCQFYSSWAQLRDTLIANWTPLGVVLVTNSDDSGPYSLFSKVLPALSMGNAVIVVPGRASSASALLLAQLFTGAGLPVGAINVLTGSDIITLAAKVSENPDVNYVTYAGNEQDGVQLCRAAASSGVHVSVTPHLGATCPFIVFESADLHSAADAVIEAAFKKKREVNWVLCVQESVLQDVVECVRVRLSSLKCVCVSSEAQRREVEAAVQQAQQQGATLVQSSAPPSSGAMYPPTLLCGATPSSLCVLSPSPGPLLPLMTFRSNTEAATLANHSPHGHGASVWTEDLTLALETCKNLCVGSVWINSLSLLDPCFPATGHKVSGTCTDGGQEGLYQYLTPSSSSSSSSSSPPRRSQVDFDTFGTEPCAAVVPDLTSSAPKSFLQFVAGKACKSVSGCTVAVPAPGGATGTVAYCPDGGEKDVRNSVEAAVKVQPGWMKKSASSRAQSLLSLAKGLEVNKRSLASAVGDQTGLEEAELSVTRLYEWASYCDKIQGSSLSVPQSGCGLALPEALGVIGVVLPDKLPLLAMVTILGAAIATGNAVVMVPSETCPLPALTFIQVLQAADLPAGLVNVVTGRSDPLTRALANHSVIRAVWYWGGPEGCQFLRHTCPLKMLRCHGDQDWRASSVLEHMWRNAVQWKSVWIPTA